MICFIAGMIINGIYVTYSITGKIWTTDTTTKAYQRGYMDRENSYDKDGQTYFIEGWNKAASECKVFGY